MARCWRLKSCPGAKGVMLMMLVMLVVLPLQSAVSEEALSSKIGLIPWGNVTDHLLKETLPASLSVVLLPMDAAKSPYTRTEHIHSFLQTQGVVAVVGPYHREAGLAAEGLHIPYLSLTPLPSGPRDHTLTFAPDMADMGMAAYDVAHHFSWSKISVFYDDDTGVSLLEKLMTNHTMTVRGWRLPGLATDQEVKKCLVEMRKVLVEASVVFCNRHNTQKILDQARGLAMLSTPPYQWLLYDPGLQLSDLLLQYHDIAVNFTILSLLPSHSTLLTPAGVTRLDHTYVTEVGAVLTSAYYGVMNTSGSLSAGREKMSEAIQQYNKDGKFSSGAHQGNFTLYIMGYSGDDKIVQMGVWLSRVPLFDKRLHFNGQLCTLNRTTPFPLRGRTAKVVMIEEPPFTMKKRDFFSRKGNSRFEGFAVDLIEEVARMLKFDYQIYLVHDGKFGSKQSNGEWNGMIGELLAGNATMSVAPLSINSDREEVVDFTKPFMTRYISVLMRVPRRETSYFEFLNPLHPIVWICTLGAFVIVSIVLYLLERIGASSSSSSSSSSPRSPGASTPSSSSGDDPRSSPRITLRESFWFIFGSLLQGNTDSSPATIPGRILTSAWWFFALILISSYTANLAAFLTVKKINTPIKSVTDLAQQTRIKYGTVKFSGVMGFFKNTNIEHFAKMWAHMSEVEPNSMVDNTTVGFAKVKEENYAFFWDTTVNKYQTIKDCDFMEIGPPFDPKGFGIGVPPGATYREELSMAILRLSDRGRLHELETKYWGARNCPDLSKPSSDETSELQIENVAGVFFILVGGILIAAVVCLGEYVGHELLRASKLDSRPKDAKSHNLEAFL